jgi:hypothetical protein
LRVRRNKLYANILKQITGTLLHKAWNARNFAWQFYIIFSIWCHRGTCLLCWYWWNCWPSLFKLSIHVFRFSTMIYYFIMIRQNDFQIRIFGHVLKPVEPEADSMSGSMLLIWAEYRTLSSWHKTCIFCILILYEPTPPTKLIEFYHNYPKYLIKWHELFCVNIFN